MHGIQVVVDPVPHATSVAASLVIPVGVVDEARPPYGALPLAWTWRERSVAGRTRSDADAAWGRRGISVHPSFGRDALRLDVIAPAGEASCGAESVLGALASEVLDADLATATFPAAVRRLASLHAVDQDDDAARFAVWRDSVTLSGPWGRHPAGERDALEAWTASEVLERYRACVDDVTWSIVVSGPVDPRAVEDAIAARFGARAERSSEPVQRPEAPTLVPGVDAWHEAEGDSVHVGWRWEIAGGSDADVGGAALSAWLARSHVGRLVASVRERHGLAYDVGADAVAARGRRWLDVWVVTSSSNVDRVRETVEDTLARLTDGPTDAEYRAVLASMRVAHARDAMRPAARCSRWIHDLVVGNALLTWDGRSDRLAEWTADAFLAYVRASAPTSCARVGSGPTAHTS